MILERQGEYKRLFSNDSFPASDSLEYCIHVYLQLRLNIQLNPDSNAWATAKRPKSLKDIYVQLVVCIEKIIVQNEDIVMPF